MKLKLLSFLAVMLMTLTAFAQTEHEYVDLGLPSGTLWATCNIGADSPEKFGDYFAWGETAPKTYYSGDNYTGSGYDDSEGSPRELLPEDDAATVNWGSEWQTPSAKQIDELINEKYTTTEWTTLNGVDGRKITSKSNGNSIFLPAAGDRLAGYINPEDGYYWSRSILFDRNSFLLYFTADRISREYIHWEIGLNVRPVRVLEEKHDYVDLGLPSGTMWATCNVGAYFPEDYGDYFYWGGKVPGVNIFTDNPSELLPENDAAAVNWNSDWRMPSLAQIEELINVNYTTTEWTTLNGVEGRKITSRSNGNSIFLPAFAEYPGGESCYWSRSINTNKTGDAWGLLFSPSRISKYSYLRDNSAYVRPVCFPKEVYTEFDESTGTLTYYYDGQRTYRTGLTEPYITNNISAVHFTSYNDKIKKAVVDPSMKDAPLTSMANMFFGGSYLDGSWNIVSYPLPNLKSIEGLENLNTAIVTSMNLMFSGCSSLETLDLSSFNTENVGEMISMFADCKKLKTIDVSSFDISKVRRMDYMFYGCQELTTIYCNKDWSTSNASSTTMFNGCEKLVGGKGTPWDSSVTDKTYARPDGGSAAPGYFTAGNISIRGDVNGDGDVTIADAVAVLNAMAGGTVPGNADVNGDKDVTIADFVAVLNIMAGQ